MKEVTFKEEFIFKVSEIKYNDLMEGFINNQISFEQNDDYIFLQLIPCQVSQIKF